MFKALDTMVANSVEDMDAGRTKEPKPKRLLAGFGQKAQMRVEQWKQKVEAGAGAEARSRFVCSDSQGLLERGCR